MRFYLNKRSINDFEARQHQEAIVRDFLENQKVDTRNLGVSTDNLRKAAFLEMRNQREVEQAYAALEAACADTESLEMKSKKYKHYIESRFQSDVKEQV